MPKGPIITPEIEALIASVYRKHPDWKAPGIRNEVEHILFENKKGFPRGWPGLSAVQKILAIARKPQLEPEPWSLASLDHEPISPVVLPRVCALYEYCTRKGIPFNTRDAKWAARLAALTDCDMSVFHVVVFRYSHTEAIFQSVNRPFNSKWLDLHLMGLAPQLEGSDVEKALREYQKGAHWLEALIAEMVVRSEVPPPEVQKAIVEEKGGTK